LRNKYSKYKPSGVEWIGDIPSHWIIKKMKYFVKICNGSDYKDFVLENGGFPVYGTGGVFSRSSKFLYDKISVLLGRKGSVDKPQIVTEPFWTSDTTYYTEIKDNVSPYYFFYLVCQIRFDLYIYGSTIPSMTKSVYDDMLFPYPPFLEQTQIVQYLDRRTHEIDKLIGLTEKKIELLKLKRTSLINTVVTKGLNPNMELKDSGVEWIGEIPSHWKIGKFRFYVNLRHGFQFRDGDFTNDGIKIIKITQLHREGYLDISSCSFIEPSRLKNFTDILIKEGDILMCLTGGTIGKIIRVGKVNEPLLQNYRVGHFSPKNIEIIDDYLFYLMSSNVITGQIFFDVRETGQPNIGLEDFNRMKICIPTISEQESIVKYLEDHTKEIDELISLEQRRIDTLKEFRQSLISEVVTGKVRVCEEDISEKNLNSVLQIN
jgi:type I restriction enzyme S subunit